MGSDTLIDKQTDIREQAFEKMRLARQNLLLNHPFFAVLALRQELVDASYWLDTMAVDGKHLFFNSDFTLKLSISEIQFVVAHEILHLAYGHLLRRMQGKIYKMEMELFNQACDYCVNRDLVNSKIGTMPEKCLYDKKYEHYISEEIFKEMLKEPEKHKDNQTIDRHIDMSGHSNQGSGAGIEKDEKGNKISKSEPVPDEKTSQQNMDKFKDDLMIANEELKDSNSAGNIPAGLQRVIDSLTKPKINWKHYLKKVIQSQLKNDLDWSQGARRSFDSRFHFPGDDKDNQLSIHIAIDTSGSMNNDMLQDFLSEVNGIMKQFENYIIRLWTFDTKVYNYKEFTPDSHNGIKKYTVLGKGGTDFKVNWDFMKENKIKPDLFVVFTDGMPCGSWGEKGFCETLYVIHTNTHIVAPKDIGKTVHYPNKKSKKANIH